MVLEMVPGMAQNQKGLKKEISNTVALLNKFFFLLMLLTSENLVGYREDSERGGLVFRTVHKILNPIWVVFSKRFEGEGVK